MASDLVAQVRSFNRTVTERVGALNDAYLGRARALGEGRLDDARQLAHESFMKVAGRSPSREAVAARASLWSRDGASAAADLAAIDATGIHGPAVELRRALLRSGDLRRSGELATSCTCQPRTQILPWLVGWEMLG
jgi:hypothetical protein